MGLGMKNLNILGVYWKIWLSGGSSRKTDIEGGLPKKGGLGQFADLREGGGGGLARKRKVVFLRGGDTPIHTMLKFYSYYWLFKFSLVLWRSIIR